MSATQTNMAKTMARQPDDLRRILSDWGPVELVIDRLARRRVTRCASALRTMTNERWTAVARYIEDSATWNR